MSPVITVSAMTSTRAGRISFSMGLSSGEMQGGDHEVDRLNADERNDDAADAVDQQVAPQQRTGADRPVRDALQGERDQRDDDQRVEDDGGEDRALRRRQLHDVERAE